MLHEIFLSLSLALNRPDISSSPRERRPYGERVDAEGDFYFIFKKEDFELSVLPKCRAIGRTNYPPYYPKFFQPRTRLPDYNVKRNFSRERDDGTIRFTRGIV